MSLLEVKDLNSYYGDSHILFDVSLHVEKNEVVALLGRNGAGKSTTFKSLMGVVTPRKGSVKLRRKSGALDIFSGALFRLSRTKPCRMSKRNIACCSTMARPTNPLRCCCMPSCCAVTRNSGGSRRDARIWARLPHS